MRPRIRGTNENRRPAWLIQAGFVTAMVMLLGVAGQPVAADVPDMPEGVEPEEGHVVGTVRELLDETGSIITWAAIGLGVGDSYINKDNTLYEVVDVADDVVRVANKGPAQMPDVADAVGDRRGLGAFLGDVWDRLTLKANKTHDKTIGIYHTHSAESYEPTSGTAFKDEGDVLEVGKALKEALEAEGYHVVWADTDHTPHDAGAYQRSRRTAAELSREKPATLIDVHRDAIPDPDSYRVTVDDKEMTGVRIVVGKQNQNRDANLEYAKRIKAIADEKFPGLIVGIFHAKGNYNQDLGPRMILLEFGTHTTTLDEAKQSTKLIAEVLPAAAGLAPGTKTAADKQVGKAAGRSAWMILLVVAIGIAGWLWLNREGLGLGRLKGPGNGDGTGGGSD